MPGWFLHRVARARARDDNGDCQDDETPLLTSLVNFILDELLIEVYHGATPQGDGFSRVFLLCHGTSQFKETIPQAGDSPPAMAAGGGSKLENAGLVLACLRVGHPWSTQPLDLWAVMVGRFVVSTGWFNLFHSFPKHHEFSVTLVAFGRFPVVTALKSTAQNPEILTLLYTV